LETKGYKQIGVEKIEQPPMKMNEQHLWRPGALQRSSVVRIGKIAGRGRDPGKPSLGKFRLV
jgi:hypothetical protein